MHHHFTQIRTGRRLTGAGFEPTAGPFAAAHVRWAAMAGLRFDVHPLLALEIATALHTLAQSPSISPNIQQSLTAVATGLQQPIVSPGVGPPDTPPVTLTLPRQVVLLLVGAMQMIYRAPISPGLRQLAHAEGHRLQDLVCDDADLHRLVDAGWRLPQ